MTASSGSSRGGTAGGSPFSADGARDPIALGVDGGGTKTDAWLARFDAAGEPVVIGKARGASTNPKAVGWPTALANLRATVEAAWGDANLAPTSVDAAVLAISGAGRPEARQQFVDYMLTTGFAKQATVEHDAEPLLAAGTPQGWGVGLIVGTGSAAIAASRDGARYVVGGWGYWFGDEGSGYWMGREALAAVARAADGRGEPTALTGAIMQRLAISDPRGALGALENAGDVRRAMASLAELVMEVAVAGDAKAGEIVDRAARDLAEMVAVAATKLGLGDAFPLALAGGVACGGELLRDRLLAALADRSMAPHPVATVPNPVVGCLRLAWRRLNAATV